MRDRFPLLLIAGLLLLGVLGNVVLGGAKRGAFADRLSTYRSEPNGARAAYLLVERSGHVGRWQQDFKVIDPGADLVLLGIDFANEQEHRERSLFGTRDAGADDEDEEAARKDFRERGWNALRARPIDREEMEKLLEHIRNGGTVVYTPWGHAENPLLDALDVSLTKADEKLGVRTLVPAQPTPYTVGVERLEATVESFLALPPGAVPFLIDETLEEPVGAVVPYGQGKLIVLTTPELAMNRALARADNARFWVALTAGLTRSKRPLLFDEYHHGFTGERSIGDFAARYGLQFAAAQLLFGVILWAASLRRFGRPKAPPRQERVGATDALFATSRIYREGRHHAHAASSVLKELCAELAAKAGVSTRASPSELSAALELRGRKDLARAVLDVSGAAAACVSELDVQRVASTAALIRRSLEHHGRTT